jgi:four helix bundle protein
MENRKPVPRDLEDRTFEFALMVRKILNSLSYSRISFEDIKQVLRSTGSIGANYIEARESLSTKDHLYRLRISRKEAKESIYWLRLLKNINPPEKAEKIDHLIKEANELKRILSRMIINKQSR